MITLFLNCYNRPRVDHKDLYHLEITNAEEVRKAIDKDGLTLKAVAEKHWLTSNNALGFLPREEVIIKFEV